jgi:excisionase family DNA binding protein
LQERKKQVETATNLTYSIPEAGAMAGLSRNGSYDAADRGEIPAIRFGRKKRVPKAIWDRKLGISSEVGK